MTGMLASVRDAREARLALAAGVDVIDLKDPASGALGALSPETVARITALVDGRAVVSATTGDLPCEAEILDAAIRRTWATGVDIVKVGVFAAAPGEGVTRAIARLAGQGVRIVPVFFAEYWQGAGVIEALAEAGAAGVMLDTCEKRGGSLTQKLSRDVLSRFVDSARSAGLMSGLAGSLLEQDVAVLAALGPDYLGFRGALCRNAERGGSLDRQALASLLAVVRAHAGPGRTTSIKGRRSHGAMAQEREG
jgi:dihydroneopterin aldolase